MVVGVFGIFDWLKDSLVEHLIPQGRLTSAAEDALKQQLGGNVFQFLPVLQNISLAAIAGLILGLMQRIRPIETVRWSGAGAWSELLRGSRRWGIPCFEYGPYVGLVAGLCASWLST